MREHSDHVVLPNAITTATPGGRAVVVYLERLIDGSATNRSEECGRAGVPASIGSPG